MDACSTVAQVQDQLNLCMTCIYLCFTWQHYLQLKEVNMTLKSPFACTYYITINMLRSPVFPYNTWNSRVHKKKSRTWIMSITAVSCSQHRFNFEQVCIDRQTVRTWAYLLTPWSTVLPEKLKRPELLKKFPAFYGNRRFLTAFTRARHLSLSWARLIQSMPPPIQPLAGPF
jgi:hypothetical protein